jgi:hypothetical protein
MGDAREHAADDATEFAFHVNKIPISAAIEGRGAQEMVALVLRLEESVRNRSEMRASDLQISDGAQVEGSVIAQNVTVCGRVKGTIRAVRVKLQNIGRCDRRELSV